MDHEQGKGNGYCQVRSNFDGIKQVGVNMCAAPNAKVLFNSSTGQLHLQARRVQLYRYSNALGLRTLLGYAYMDAASSDEDLMRIVKEAHGSM